jgi:trehalose 6-phosphate phosphatase
LRIDKGTAITEVIAAHGLQSALYLGDDRTDIDAFRALRRLTADGTCAGIAVAVLHPEAPANLAAAADITLSSIARVPAFLRLVLRLAAET